MKKHTKIYLKYFGYSIADFIPCEVCGSKAVDIHHIEPRGIGGSKTKDVIENLQALCRSCHHEADFGTELSKEKLKEIHKKTLSLR
jgi:5-methylcytosine-specific restriction endonuclease McrA